MNAAASASLRSNSASCCATATFSDGELIFLPVAIWVCSLVAVVISAPIRAAERSYRRLLEICMAAYLISRIDWKVSRATWITRLDA